MTPSFWTGAVWAEKRLDDNDCKVIAQLLRSGALDKVEFLYVYNNQIGDDGIKALADALTSSSGALASCQQIALNDNPGSDAPVKEALAARKK